MINWRRFLLLIKMLVIFGNMKDIQIYRSKVFRNYKYINLNLMSRIHWFTICSFTQSYSRERGGGGGTQNCIFYRNVPLGKWKWTHPFPKFWPKVGSGILRSLDKMYVHHIFGIFFFFGNCAKIGNRFFFWTDLFTKKSFEKRSLI